MGNPVSGSEGMLQNLKETQVLCTALLTICLANSTQPAYATVLAFKWEKCGMSPRMHARTRSRKALLWEAASLRF